MENEYAFTFLGIWTKMYESLPNDEMKKAFFEGILNYGVLGKAPDKEDGIIYALLIPVMAAIDKENGKTP